MTSQLAAHLVAFASRVDQRPRQSCNDERRTPDSESHSSERLRAILDSLASICVQRGKREVYAVAIQFKEQTDGSNGGIVALTIAGNDNVPKAVVTHLSKVWHKLQDIAHACYRFYTNKRKQLPMNYRGKSPDSSEALLAATELVLELQEIIYRHGLEKFTSRVYKRYSKFQDFVEALSTYSEEHELSESHLWDTLADVALGLEKVENFLRTHTATESPFVELIWMMSALTGLIQTLVGSPSVLQWPLLVPGNLKHPKTV
jgi:hypothetical protein